MLYMWQITRNVDRNRYIQKEEQHDKKNIVRLETMIIMAFGKYWWWIKTKNSDYFIDYYDCISMY